MVLYQPIGHYSILSNRSYTRGLDKTAQSTGLNIGLRQALQSNVVCNWLGTNLESALQ